ncbi:uncharacterized protein LACBIDRAFT_303143 [Laccaria bicolor S238N-H82]|uniref:Predicted protein n=1 Tax=Laccaria bicolor (strain S238N-H82 / ATCC MYA-4686) TaxID=486041 RepID=B0DJ09_LACBS|nr:uncharacterized protein LACBIDRAFT_303143 [Laccaria bicolor S238N-H82]EDR05325.1 predicted protein [Laccaria bicolor S238N-H82]|eukprot:XP_001883883.1 predicted protein [Laccaria bicolor S238N-H82]
MQPTNNQTIHEQPNNPRPPCRGTRVEPRRHNDLAATQTPTTCDVVTITASSSPVAERMEEEEEGARSFPRIQATKSPATCRKVVTQACKGGP